MRSRFSLPVSGAFLFIFLLVFPAAAQVTAKEAWRDLRGQARDLSVMIASQSVTDYGTSLVAQNVRIFAQDDPAAVVIEMPELRVEPRGDAVALIPSPQFTIRGQPASNDTFVISVTHSGEILLALTDDRIALDLVFGQLSAALTEATRAGQRQDASFQVMFDGFNGSARVEREGSVDVALESRTTRYAFAFQDSAGDQSADARIDGLRFELAGAEWDMLSDEVGSLRAAFDAGFFARLMMSTAASSGRSTQTLDGAQIAVNSTGGGSDFVLDVSQGAVSLEASASAVELSGRMAPYSGSGRLDEIGLRAGAPLLATAQDARFFYGVNFTGLSLSPEMMAMMGATDLGTEPITLIADVSALGRLTQDLGPEFGQGSAPPLDLTTVSLDRLEASIGGAQLTGGGAFAFLGGMLASMDAPVPNGTGDFVFELIGGDALLTRLGAMGLIPPEQQFVARMMMNGLGRPIGDDQLRSEVAIRPGGVVSVNGAPLPF